MNFFCKYKQILLVVLISLLLLFNACKSNEKVSKEVRDAEKLELQMDKEAEKEYEAAIKHHDKIQSKQSKKIMKDMKKESANINHFQKRSLWDRLFRRNCP